IAPSELAQLQAHGVFGIVTAGGSALSHSAILARSLHLPLIVNVPNVLQKVADGDVLLMDGSDGTVTINPPAQDLRAYRVRLRTKPRRTRDNVDIAPLANAESCEDVTQAHALGAHGLGLYRTESLFLQRNELPDEQEQFETYPDAALGMSWRPVTCRTLDRG